jgi:glycosyltransferase involved in cell wall biosynthesis
MPRVMVIMPVYNPQPQHLAESIASIIASLQNDSVLLVGLDGKCSFECLDVLDRIDSGTNRNFLRIVNFERRGLVSTLNSLVHECDCEYIARADSDDICLPHRMSLQLSALQERTDADFCGTQITRCDTNLKPFGRQRRYPTTFKGQLIYSSFLNNPMAHPTIMMRRHILESLQYQEKPGAEDWDLYVRLWRRGYKSFNLGQVSTLYRIHSHQITQNNRSTDVIDELKEQSLQAALMHNKNYILLQPLQKLLRRTDLTRLTLQVKPWIDR